LANFAKLEIPVDVDHRLVIPACGRAVLMAGILAIAIPLAAQRVAGPPPPARPVPDVTLNDLERIRPSPAPAELIPFICEYGAGADTLIVLERGAKLFVIRGADELPISTASFVRDSAGHSWMLRLGAKQFSRRPVGTDEG
jgi:hypothetical protein